jgi:hypothetical protein
MPSVVQDGRHGDDREQDKDKVGEGHRSDNRLTAVAVVSLLPSRPLCNGRCPLWSDDAP